MNALPNPRESAELLMIEHADLASSVAVARSAELRAENDEAGAFFWGQVFAEVMHLQRDRFPNAALLAKRYLDMKATSPENPMQLLEQIFAEAGLPLPGDPGKSTSLWQRTVQLICSEAMPERPGNGVRWG